MKFSLALITGASSGIGRALCERLAKEGISLILHGRDKKALEELASKLSSSVDVQILCADLAISRERQLVIETIKYQIPDLVINNAGFALYNDALNYKTDEQMKILEVDGMALLELTLEAAKALRAADKKGVILNVSSVAGFFIFPYFSVYAASKSFVNTLSQSLDEELKSEGIRVLVACPGMVDTNFRVRSGGKLKESSKGIMTAQYAAERIWKQIQKQKIIEIFNWKYHLAVLARPFIPSWIYMKILKKNIKDRCR